MEQVTLGMLLLDTGAHNKSSFLASLAVGHRGV
jgi:hypothetical protein